MEALLNKAWVAEGFRYIKELSCGSYVNFPYRKLRNYLMAYYGQHVKALQRVKTQVDPGNVFRFPQSIKPLSSPGII